VHWFGHNKIRLPVMIKKLILIIISFLAGNICFLLFAIQYNGKLTPSKSGDEYFILLPSACSDKSKKALLALGRQYSLQEKGIIYKPQSASDYDRIIVATVEKASISTTSELLDAVEGSCNEVQINIPRNGDWGSELTKVLLREQVANENLSANISVNATTLKVFVHRQLPK